MWLGSRSVMIHFLSSIVLVPEFLHFASVGVSPGAAVLVLAHTADAASCSFCSRSSIPRSLAAVSRLCPSQDRGCPPGLGGAGGGVVLEHSEALGSAWVFGGTSVSPPITIPRAVASGALGPVIPSVVSPAVPLPTLFCHRASWGRSLCHSLCRLGHCTDLGPVSIRLRRGPPRRLSRHPSRYRSES